jgi:Profilin
MSWQDYVDNQLIASQCVSKACIAGHDGGVWAKSEGFDVSIFIMQKKNEKKKNFAISKTAFFGEIFLAGCSINYINAF